MTVNPWEHAARAFEPAPPPRFPTPGHLATHITPTTVNTPALTLPGRPVSPPPARTLDRGTRAVAAPGWWWER